MMDGAAVRTMDSSVNNAKRKTQLQEEWKANVWIVKVGGDWVISAWEGFWRRGEEYFPANDCLEQINVTAVLSSDKSVSSCQPLSAPPSSWRICLIHPMQAPQQTPWQETVEKYLGFKIMEHITNTIEYFPNFLIGQWPCHSKISWTALYHSLSCTDIHHFAVQQ